MFLWSLLHVAFMHYLKNSKIFCVNNTKNKKTYDASSESYNN